MTFYIIKCIRQNLTPGCHGNAFSPIKLPLWHVQLDFLRSPGCRLPKIYNRNCHPEWYQYPNFQGLAHGLYTTFDSDVSRGSKHPACNSQLFTIKPPLVCGLQCLVFLPRCMKCRRGLTMRITSVCLSVRLSVKHVNCDKTEEKYVQIFIPYKRSFTLVSEKKNGWWEALSIDIDLDDFEWPWAFILLLRFFTEFDCFASNYVTLVNVRKILSPSSSLPFLAIITLQRGLSAIAELLVITGFRYIIMRPSTEKAALCTASQLSVSPVPAPR